MYIDNDEKRSAENDVNYTLLSLVDQMMMMMKLFFFLVRQQSPRYDVIPIDAVMVEALMDGQHLS